VLLNNGAGSPDLVVTSGTRAVARVLFNNGTGQFGRNSVTVTLPFAATGVAAGDFNGDGVKDFAISGPRVGMLLGNGDVFKATLNTLGSRMAPVLTSVQGPSWRLERQFHRPRRREFAWGTRYHGVAAEEACLRRRKRRE
jgi:hypothetical protein